MRNKGRTPRYTHNQYRILTRRMLSACLAVLVCPAFASQTSSAFAQQAAATKPLLLVTWFGTGAIVLPVGPLSI